MSVCDVTLSLCREKVFWPRRPPVISRFPNNECLSNLRISFHLKCMTLTYVWLSLTRSKLRTESGYPLFVFTLLTMTMTRIYTWDVMIIKQTFAFIMALIYGLKAPPQKQYCKVQYAERHLTIVISKHVLNMDTASLLHATWTIQIHFFMPVPIATHLAKWVTQFQFSIL